MKRGKPKSIDKAANRRHSVVLTVRAELVYRQACKLRGGDQRWFHKSVSQMLVDEHFDDPRAILKAELLKEQEARDASEKRMAEIVTEIRKIGTDRARKVVQRELRENAL